MLWNRLKTKITKMQTQISNQTNLPSEAARFLRSLESRNLTLSIQKKKSEVGDWRNEFQIRGGAAFGPDWAMLNRFRPHFVRYCEERNLVDEQFSDLAVVPRLERIGGEHTLLTREEKKVRSNLSDEKAMRSRIAVKAEKTEAQIIADRESRRRWRERNKKKCPNTYWTEEQTRYLQSAYYDYNVWPQRELAACGESARRREAITAEINRLGGQRKWIAIIGKITRMRQLGQIEYKHEMQPRK